jgi:hypothetical protein
MGGTSITTDRLDISGHAGAGHVVTDPVMFQAMSTPAVPAPDTPA